MTRRSFIACVVLAMIAASAGTVAWRLWRQQERALLARATVPTVPDLGRWPGGLKADVETSTAVVRTTKEPGNALGRLAGLYLANGFIGEAKQALETLERIEDENARWPYLLGDIALQQGDVAAAEQAFQRAVRLDPRYAPAWIRLGHLLLERGALERAEQCYAQAARVAPGNVRALYHLVSFEARHGKRRDPRQHLIDLARSQPGLQEVHHLLAQLQEAAGFIELASAERRLAARARHRIDTEDPWLDDLADFGCEPYGLIRFARRFAREHRVAAAEKLLKRALRLAPDLSEPRLALAELLLQEGRSAEGREVLMAASTACPDEPELRLALARALLLEHKPGDAAAALRAALERWPERGDLHALLGRAWREAGENELALLPLQRALELNPEQAEARYDLGCCLMALGRRDEARQAVEHALLVRPEYAEALVLLGSAALENGELELAERHILHLHQLQPDEPGSQLLFAALHMTKGNRAQEAREFAEADRLYRAGLEVSPQFSPLLKETGLLAARRAQYFQMVDIFERYLRVEPRDLEAYLQLATAYRETEQIDQVERALERGLAMAQKLRDAARVAEFEAQLDAL